MNHNHLNNLMVSHHNLIMLTGSFHNLKFCHQHFLPAFTTTIHVASPLKTTYTTGSNWHGTRPKLSSIAPRFAFLSPRCGCGSRLNRRQWEFICLDSSGECLALDRGSAITLWFPLTVRGRYLHILPK